MPTGTISHARSIIKTQELITLLQNSILDPKSVPLNQNKINAIKILLAKAIPDLKAVENNVVIEGNINTSLTVKYVDTDSQ